MGSASCRGWVLVVVCLKIWCPENIWKKVLIMLYLHITRTSQWSSIVLPGMFLLNARHESLLLLSFSPSAAIYTWVFENVIQTNFCLSYGWIRKWSVIKQKAVITWQTVKQWYIRRKLSSEGNGKHFSQELANKLAKGRVINSIRSSESR